MCSSFSTPVHTIIHIQVLLPSTRTAALQLRQILSLSLPCYWLLHCSPSFFSLAIGYYTAVPLSLAILLAITLQSLFLQPCYWLLHCSLSFFSLAIGYYTAVSISFAVLLVITLQSFFSLAFGYYTAVSLSLAILLVITLQSLFLQPCYWLLHCSLTFKDFWSHPSCTALVVCHVSLYIAGRAKVADLQHCSTLDQQQTETIITCMVLLFFFISLRSLFYKTVTYIIVCSEYPSQRVLHIVLIRPQRGTLLADGVQTSYRVLH